MAAIKCPDCGNLVSQLAAQCPSCARPNPALTEKQLNALEAESKAAKKAEESNEAWGCILVGWAINAILAGAFKGTAGFIVALILGPFVWML